MSRAFDPLSRVLGILAAIAGTGATWFYVSAGLSLSHYDAKAHLVVARRILDSLTPSWEQIGAVWLPLPHVLNALPIQIDFFYRTGASAIAISIVSFAIAVAAASAIVVRLTGSPAGGALAAILIASNPDIVYLQATPMTEPLLFALSALVVWQLTHWATSESIAIPSAAGWTIVLAALTRYEAWPVIAAAMVLAALAKWRRGAAFAAVVQQMMRLAVYPALAVIGFVLMSRITVGEWFVTGGFYVPEPAMQGHPRVVIKALLDGARELGGSRLVLAAMISAAALAVMAALRRRDTALLMPLALAAAGALPFYAYLSGHPFRIRYDIPLIFAFAPLIGTAVAQTRRAAWPVAIVIAMSVLLQVRPFDADAPMIKEALIDRDNSIGRQRVTACLKQSYDGTSIVMSMGSLAHYMQELSAAGFAIKDFVHEGSGPLWNVAVSQGPAPVAGWIAIEEVAEGGDVLFQRAKVFAEFLRGFDRVCEGGNVALYKRRNTSS